VIQLLQRLLDPAYLYAIDPGPLGRWKIVYVAWAILLAGGAAAAWWRGHVRRNRPWQAATVTACACGAGLLFLVTRFLAPLAMHLPSHTRFLLYDVWTARVWPLSATLVAVLSLPIGWVSYHRLPRLLQRQVDAWTGALAQDSPPLSLWENSSLGVIHLLGLACLWYSADRSLWWAIPSLFLLSILPLCVRPHRLRFETLAPLLPGYVSAVLSIVARRLGVDVTAYQAFSFPDPWSPWLNVPALVVLGIAYTLWAQVRLVARRWRPAVPIVLCAAVGLWMIAMVAVHHTQGVTGSDPYCYVQMAIDLAENGSPLHDFPLAGLARELGLPTWPAVHIGYQPPFFENRSPTMWSIGWPLLLAPFYWLGGTEALYWAAPLMGALALVVTWFMANEALHREARSVRWAVAALTCLLVATSPEGSERVLVPMADAAAQLFTALTLWLLLRSRRERPIAHGLLAGASFGVAYFMRHPQLPLGVAALIAAGLLAAKSRHPVRSILALLVPFALAGLTIAIPDLLYHKTVFGGWLRTESTEWFLISIGNVGRSLFAVLEQGLLRREELGFVAPFVVYGGWLLWRGHRQPGLILGSGFAAVFAFHLCYAALRPRDLIAILPVLYLCAAHGFVAVWRRGQGRRTVAAALLLVCCATLLAVRSYRTLAAPWREDVITFGHVSASQRRALETLRAITPDDAVIGSMLNSGAIELHAGRQAVHPAPWTEAELRTWVDALQSLERPFYVLDDGEEMLPVLERLRTHYVVRPIETLNLPYFALGGGNLPRSAVLYRVEQAR
jgi:uncharacterized membrane protein YjjB (DUF3815 family)